MLIFSKVFSFPLSTISRALQCILHLFGMSRWLVLVSANAKARVKKLCSWISVQNSKPTSKKWLNVISLEERRKEPKYGVPFDPQQIVKSPT